MKLARCFIGLPLSDKEKSCLRAATKKLDRRGMRWLPPENYHITLAFLGPCQPRRLVAVRRCLMTIRTDRFTLLFGQVASFPEPGGCIVAAIPECSPALLALHGQVAAALRSAGACPDTKPFRPHITLGRRHSGGLFDPIKIKCSLQADRVQLLQSETSDAGRTYRSLADFCLA